MPSLRHRVRTITLQVLFELDATDHAPDEVVARLLPIIDTFLSENA